MTSRFVFLALFFAVCALHAAPPTSGQYEVRKRRSDGLYDAYGVTLTDGQVFGQMSGVPAAITPTVSWSTLSGVPANVAAFGGLADAAGWLKNDGAGNVSWGAVQWADVGSIPSALTAYINATQAAGVWVNNGSAVSWSQSPSLYSFTATNQSNGWSAVFDGYAITWTQPSSGGKTVKIQPQTQSVGGYSLIIPSLSSNANIVTTADSSTVTNTMLANKSITIGGNSTALGGTVSASSILDSISSTRGTVLYRGASGWAALGTGTTGYFLQTGGFGADPSWAAVSTGLTIGTTTITSGTSGRILYDNAGVVGELTTGSGVATAIGNAVNGTGGLLTYSIIGTSGSAVPLLNAANTFSAQTSVTGAANTQAVTVTGTVSGSGATRALASLSDTWTSTGSVSPRILDLSITDSGASNINYGSTALIQGSRNGTIVFKVAHDGTISLPANGFYIDPNAGKIQIPYTAYFSINGDTLLYRDGAGILAQRNSTSAQLLRVYNTYTSSTSWEAAVMDWQTTSNTLLIGSNVGGGGGTARDVKFVRGGTTKVTVGANVTTHAQPVQLPSYTVSGLPSASTCGAGACAFVTDATATTAYTTVAGGGSNKVLVVSDGTNWIIH